MGKRTTVKVNFHPAHLGQHGDEHPLDTALRIIAVGFAPPDPDGWSDPDKYGIPFENDVFLMRPECWCARDGVCPWCTGCRCPEGTYVPHVDGQPVTEDAYEAFFVRVAGEPPPYRDGAKYRAAREAWGRRADAANARRERRQMRKVCDYCIGGGIFARFAPVTRDRARHYYDPPNFWFKPDDFRVRWYKYIGRDTATNKERVPDDLLERVFAKHPNGMTVRDAIAELERRTEETSQQWANMFHALNARFAGGG